MKLPIPIQPTRRPMNLHDDDKRDLIPIQISHLALAVLTLGVVIPSMAFLIAWAQMELSKILH